MNIESIIVLVIGIILAIVILRFITKILAKIIAFMIVAGFVIVVLFYWNGGLVNLGKENFILYELQKKYCIEKQDTIKCECIIEPLIADIESKYSENEIEELKENRLKSVQIIIQSIEDNRKQIKNCLEEKDSDHGWEDFIQDLKSLKLEKKVKGIIDKFKDNSGSSEMDK